METETAFGAQEYPFQLKRRAKKVSVCTKEEIVQTVKKHGYLLAAYFISPSTSPSSGLEEITIICTK